jgi:predicted ATPase
MPKSSLYDCKVQSVLFKSDSGPSEKDKLVAMTAAGDDMNEWLWDGPEDSDEEIEEMAIFKNQIEKQQGVKFSKNGIKQYVEAMIATESASNTESKATAKLWENRMETPNIKFFLKKGGSEFSDSQPFIRTEARFNKVFKMQKLATCIYMGKH